MRWEATGFNKKEIYDRRKKLQKKGYQTTVKKTRLGSYTLYSKKVKK